MRRTCLELILVLAWFSSASHCLAQEGPKRAGKHNRVVAAVIWPVRTYYVETKRALQDMRTDRALRAEAVGLFGAAAFENSTLEIVHRDIPAGVVGYPARFFVGSRPHGAQLWLMSMAGNLALLDLFRHVDSERKNDLASIGGTVALSSWYVVAGLNNLSLSRPTSSNSASDLRRSIVGSGARFPATLDQAHQFPRVIRFVRSDSVQFPTSESK